MPFDDLLTPVAVPAKQPPKLSCVAASAATAADVARSVAETPDERHDAATCCGEQHEPDVGEGWRELGPDETLQAGDECDIGVNEPRWVVTQRAGRRVSENTDGDRYRRRVTPEEPEPQPRLAATWAAAHRVVVEALAAEQEEVKRLRSEVERLRLEPSVQEEIVAWSVDLHDARQEIKRLTAEVARLRLRPDEVRFLLGVKNFDGHLVNDLLKRQGGGE
jgi:hypothetical protein